MTPFAAVVTPYSLIFTSPDGKTHTISSDHAEFSNAKYAIKHIQAERADGADEEDVSLLIYALVAMLHPAEIINAQGQGKVVVRDGVIFYNGQEIHSTITERVLWLLSEGFVITSYINFLENLMENPSKRSVDQLYTFIERHKLGITDDGHILAYKRVRADFRDIYTGKLDNSPGQIVEMARNQVDDDPQSTCSDGLHFCSLSYLPNYGAYDGNRIIIVKINPRDVVSVPVDYNAAKVRCCRYEVLSEYTGSDKDDLLAHKPVFETSEFTGDDEETESVVSNVGFDVGDVVRCIDGDGLGQTDICEGTVYTVDDVSDDGTRIYIGTEQGIGRYYSIDRFTLVDDEADRSDEIFDFDDVAYDRGYDAGAAAVRGTDVVKEDFVSMLPRFGGATSDDYCEGFDDGWNDGVLRASPRGLEVDVNIGGYDDSNQTEPAPVTTPEPLKIASISANYVLSLSDGYMAPTMISKE